jgi:lipid-A-disaccharide synthase
MRYYLIAGEASGDMHGANLMKGILQHDPIAEFRFWGGDKMQTVCGHAPVKHIKDLSIHGLFRSSETFTNYFRKHFVLQKRHPAIQA